MLLAQLSLWTGNSSFPARPCVLPRLPLGMTGFLRTILILLLPLVSLTAVHAQTSAATSRPKPNLFDQFSDGMKQPTDWLNWDADLRIRDEFYQDIITYSEH